LLTESAVSVTTPTPALFRPWESLRVNARRQILVGDNGSNSSQDGPEVDVYDLSGDCRSPQLMASTPATTPST
jgi:hypothetical protein